MATHEMASNLFILPNFTIVFEFVAFLLILWVIQRKVVPRVQRAMAARQELIRGQLEESAAAKTRLELAEAEYKAAVASTREELARIREQAHADAERTKQEVLGAAREEAGRIQRRAEEQLAGERQRAFDALRGEVGGLAAELAGRILGEVLSDPELQHRVIDRFLGDIEGREAERTG